MNTDEIKVYSVKQAASLLQTSNHQIRKMIQQRDLPAVKVGREWRIPAHALQGFLAISSI